MKMVVALLLMLAGLNANAAGSRLQTEDCDFGEVYAFNRTDCQVTLFNTGDVPIQLSQFKADKAEDSVPSGGQTIAPHAKIYIKVTVNTANDLGRSRHIFRFKSDEPDIAQRAFAARGFVLSVLDEGKPIVDFGVVELGDSMPSRDVDLTSHDLDGFRIEKVSDAPAYVDVQVADDGKSAKLRLRDNAPWGYLGEFVRLRTNSKVQEEVWIGVQADVHGKIVPNSNPFSLGVMRAGSSNEQLIRLTSKDRKDFAVGHVELDKLHGAATVEPCRPIAEGCKMIKLHISDDQPVGSMIGKLLVELPDNSQKLLIAVNGIFLAKDAKIEKLDAADLINKANPNGKASMGSNPVDIKSAIRSAVQDETEASPEGKGPLLKWSVANEASIHGYQIFRSGDEKGPFVLLNKPTIATKKRDNSGSAYQYRDNTAESGKTYWYYIGIVYNDGHKQQLTGPQKVVAK